MYKKILFFFLFVLFTVLALDKLANYGAPPADPLLRSDGRLKKPVLTPEQVHEALTQQAPLREDFERFVKLQRLGHGQEKDAFFAVPVSYSPHTLPSDIKRDDPIINYSTYAPWWRRKYNLDYPLDAYQLPIDPENDRHANGVLRWQPMLIDGAEKMVLHSSHDHPFIQNVRKVSILFHLPNLRPVDKEMYLDRMMFGTPVSTHERRYGYYRERYFPKISDQDDPLSLIRINVQRAFGVEASGNEFRNLIEYHQGAGPYWDLLNQKGPFENLHKSEEHGLLAYFREPRSPEDSIYYRSKRDDKITLRMECHPSTSVCSGEAYFVDEELGVEFSFPIQGPATYKDWREILIIAGEKANEWHINEDEQIRELWLSSPLRVRFLENTT